jgi:hypothetical protein
MRLPKIAARYLAAYAIVFILVYLLPGHIHRRDYDRAFTAWLKDQTPQTEAALRVEQHKNEIIYLQDSGVISLILVVIAGGAYEGLRFVRGLSKRRRVTMQ